MKNIQTKIFVLGLSAILTPVAAFGMAYEIQVAYDDSIFIINDEKYSAQTYCFAHDGFDVGDWVVFLEGSPFGACATATIANTRTGETCELFCE